MTKALVTVQNGQPMTNSRDVADLFGKQHGHILRSIDALQRELVGSPKMDGLFHEHAEHHDKARKIVRGYSMTKDGFVLLAMGFTGKEALRFKLAYITRFNELVELRQPLATP